MNDLTCSVTSPSKEFLKGMRAVSPLVLSGFPFGLIYGALGISAGLSTFAIMAMSAFVFAGSAQFIAVSLILINTPIPIIIITTFIVNLRHLLYSAALLPYVRNLGQKWRIPLAFLLTDEAFAATVGNYRSEGKELKHFHHLGASLGMYISWQIWTYMGIILGQQIPDANSWGLDFAMPVGFIGMVIPFVKNKSTLICVFTAGVSSLLAAGLPYKLGLIVAALLGVIAGVLSERINNVSK